MTVVVGNTSTGAANATSLTFSHTVANATQSLIVAGVALTAQSVSSVTYNGDALTFLRNDNISGALLEIWYKAGVASGVADVVITPSASALIIVAVVDFSIANIPDNDLGETGTATSGSNTVTGPTEDDFIMDFLFKANSETPVAGADQAGLAFLSDSGNSISISSQDGVDGGAMTISWDTSNLFIYGSYRVPCAERIMASMAGSGGLAGPGGMAGSGGGLAG